MMSEIAILAVLISANAEWKQVRAYYPDAAAERSPYGEFFMRDVGKQRLLFFHGGWGKIDAAGSTQYVIDRWKPVALVNLGTCGGLAGSIERYSIVLANRTVIYDIIEQMGDSKEAIRDYTTVIDLSWLKERPMKVVETTLVSADRDLVVKELPKLRKEYQTVAGDWESGAIARVAARNGVRVLILRGVSDLVGKRGGEAYGSMQTFEAGTAKVMKMLLDGLVLWVPLVVK